MVCLAAACGKDAPSPAVPGDPAAGSAVTSVFDCGADERPFAFTVRTIGPQLALWLPLEFGRPYLVLEQVRAASGSKYAADDVMVWLHGDEAMLEVADESFKSCKRNSYQSVWEHAKLNGVDFRATGNEPGWVLEISQQVMIDLDYDYGASRIHARSAEPTENRDEMRTTYVVDENGQHMTVEILAETCADSMTGTQFESTVSITIDDRDHRVLRGCGRALH
jgi:putative lipoprotein